MKKLRKFVVLAVLFIIFIYSIFQYNKLVSLDQKVKVAWAQVENVYQRRNDLIPNLVEIVKGYAKHEKELFIQVTEARTKWQNAKSVSEKEIAASEIDRVIGRLLFVVENYPQIKASTNFLSLQDELAGTENRIAVERRRYNLAVEQYNRNAKLFPNFIFVRIFGFDSEKNYFQATEQSQKPPQIKF
ncbi:MAG: LemA family protein [Candidatus Omnitrophica bacterium]|nr:LemA family protein [Candidatus Omnitrophota bacterium]MCM8809309.1 LemA family protein [Candidatus Omnitrophota bacterium]MCM8811167.1 LemA family protein [Candidatus Omnitrophota bacterium]MCM8832496.1 LemA family protein [Candidatus Omnitrophota bacterium]